MNRNQEQSLAERLLCAERITSRQNPLVKELCALSDKKMREKMGTFRFDGVKLAGEAMEKGVELTAIAVCETAKDRVLRALGNRTIPPFCRVVILEEGVFLKISEEKSPEGIICAAKVLDKFHKMTTINNIPSFLSPDEKVIFLHEIRDPGNLGTLLRTAAAFGIGCVLLSRDAADLYAPRTLRAAMGAIFRLPTLRIEGDGADAVKELRDMGRSVYATALDPTAKALGSFPLSRADCFVIGNEGHGLPESVIAASTHSVFIPMEEGSESLNAAMAGTICMWEMKRVD